MTATSGVTLAELDGLLEKVSSEAELLATFVNVSNAGGLVDVDGQPLRGWMQTLSRRIGERREELRERRPSTSFASRPQVPTPRTDAAERRAARRQSFRAKAGLSPEGAL